MKRKSTVIEIVLTYCLFCTCMRVFAIYAWFSCKHACEVIASHISLSKPIYVKAVKTKNDQSENGGSDGRLH